LTLRRTADYAETYIYIWSVAMPADEDDKLLHAKKGDSTYGVQLIATGHTLVDAYRSFDVDSYAKLAAWTGDSHHRAVATLPLHETKNMTATPGRTYDLKGPGGSTSTGALELCSSPGIRTAPRMVALGSDQSTQGHLRNQGL
jgi:hypothetical protein